MDAVILAGGPAVDESEDGASKSLLEIDGKPMYRYVIEALQEAPSVGRIAVVLPEGVAVDEEPGDDGRAFFIQSSGAISATVRAGIAELGLKRDDLALFVSADIPLLSADAIEDFVTRSLKSGADICYPIIPRDAVDERFPSAKRTYVKLREGVYTGGNLGIARVGVVEDRMTMMEGFFDKRKSPLRLFEMLGVRLLTKFLLRIVSIRDLERRISQVFDASGAAIETDYSEVGFDVDKPADLELVVREIKVRNS